jgi:hypothetical protein
MIARNDEGKSCVELASTAAIRSLMHTFLMPPTSSPRPLRIMPLRWQNAAERVAQGLQEFLQTSASAPGGVPSKKAATASLLSLRPRTPEPGFVLPVPSADGVGALALEGGAAALPRAAAAAGGLSRLLAAAKVTAAAAN